MGTAATPSLEQLLAHEGWMRAMARGLLFDETAVDDVVQEAWLAALRSGPRDAGKLRAWLGSVARNLARMAGRAAVRRARREGAVARPEALPSTAAMVEQAELRRRVVEAVLSLDEPYRTTVLWRYFEDLTPAQIAARSGEPGGTVRARLKRGLDHLRTQLDAAHAGDRRRWALALVPVGVLGWGRGAWAGTAAAAVVVILVGVGVGVVGVTVRRPEKLPDSARADSGAANDSTVTPADVAPVPLSGPGGTQSRGSVDVESRRIGEGGSQRAVASAERADHAVAGIVRVLGGDPLPEGLRVWAVGLHARGPEHPLSGVGPDGRFTLEPIDDSPVRVGLLLDEPSRFRVRGDAEVQVNLGDRDVTFTLELLPSVRVHVIDYDSTAPLVASVEGLAIDAERDATRVYGPPGASTVYFAAAGHVARSVELTFPEAGVHERPEPIRLVAGSALTGRVVDASGEGIAGALVAVARLDHTPGVPALDVAVASADAQGRYRVDTVPSGRYRLHAFAQGFDTRNAIIQVGGATEAPAIRLAQFSGPREPAGSARPPRERFDAVTTVDLTDVPLADALDALELALGVRVRGEGDWAALAELEIRLNLQVDALPLRSVFIISADFVGFTLDDDGRMIPPK